MVVIHFEIEKCAHCRHLDHSGAFTIGGARDICGHYDSVELCPKKSKNSFKKEYHKYYVEMKSEKWEHWEYHWYHRIVDVDSIPEWCPLKHGKQY